MIIWTRQLSISILGSSGGVAKAVLAIFNQFVQDKKDPIYPYISKAKIHLVDINQKEIEYYKQLFPNLSEKIKLYLSCQ